MKIHQKTPNFVLIRFRGGSTDRNGEQIEGSGRERLHCGGGRSRSRDRRGIEQEEEEEGGKALWRGGGGGEAGLGEPGVENERTKPTLSLLDGFSPLSLSLSPC